MPEVVLSLIILLIFGTIATITEMILTKNKVISSSPSIFSRIKRFLRIKPSVQEQILALNASKEFIEAQRAEIDTKINDKEKNEFELMERGSRSSNDLEKRQIAGKVARLRNELRFERNTANIYSQQLLIIQQYVHSLQMSNQLTVQLPNCEDLAKCASSFEESLSNLSQASDFAMTITKDASTDLMREQEASIMNEFKQIESQKEQQRKEETEKIESLYSTKASVSSVNRKPEKA